MCMDSKHFFSVIIPTYNRRNFLKIAVESVLAQTFENFELIIVDDGSTDDTSRIAKDYQDKRIVFLRQKNKGPSSARNLGIKTAKGKFISFLDSDDRYRRQKLETAYEYITQNPDYKIFHTEELWYRNSQYLAQKKEHKKPEGYVFNYALKTCCISLSTCCVHKDVFKNIGFFDEIFPVCEDYEFWLRATLTYPVKLIPLYLTIKEGGHAGQQSQEKGLDKYRFLAIYKLIKNNQLSCCQLKHALCNLKEKANIYVQGAQKRKKAKEIKEIEMKLMEIKKTYGN